MQIAELTPSSLAVLKAIRRDGPISRSELPAMTGLSGATITQLTADLIERGLILEQRLPSTGPGRPRTNLVVNADNAIVIGASIGDRVMSTGFVDLMGKHLFARDLPWPNPETLPAMAHCMADNLAQAIAASPFAPQDISQIVIALPALVDSVKGEVHFMATFAAGPTPFAQIIADRLGIAVIIENDMIRMARSEHWFGRAKDLASFTLIYVGHAIGGARYVGGLPVAGVNGLNTELGHVKTAYGPDARPCYCGGRGCVSAYGAVFGILQPEPPFDLSDLAHVGHMDAQFEALLNRAGAGDARAQRALTEAGTHLGAMIANHITSTDPGSVVVLFAHGGLMEYAAAPMHAAIREHSFPGFLPGTQVVVAVTNEEWKWQGIAALALERTYLARG
jgi:predicted NBD/HSP70 family sugar kinase